MRNQLSFFRLPQTFTFHESLKDYSNDHDSRLSNFKKVCETEFKEYKNKVCSGEIEALDPPSIRTFCDGRTRIYGHDWIRDVDRKFAVCMPPKAGCTTMARMWLAIQHKDGNYLNFTDGDHGMYESARVRRLLPRFNMEPDRLWKLSSDSWYRMINVRHPFERLFSGWRDKFRKGKYNEFIDFIFDRFFINSDN